MDTRIIREALRRTGPIRVGALAGAIGASPATLRRGITELGPELVRRGKARASEAALRRAVDGVRQPLTLYEVNPDGTLRAAGELHAVAPFGWRVDALVDDVEGGWFEADPRALVPGRDLDLPWFLLDLAPQGFLGRAWLEAHPGLGFPAQLGRWSGDDVVRYAVHHAEDAPGAWLLGEEARVRFEAGPRDAPVAASTLDAALEARVGAALRRGGGSSVGGEQPKLTLAVEDGGLVRHLIVKYSPPRSSPIGARWADLLLAEHIAAHTLARAGHAAARSEIHDVGERRYLLVERFDRHGARGRSGAVSLRAADHSGVGRDLGRWSAALPPLISTGHLPEAAAGEVAFLDDFGVAYANTDMHLGNLSLQLRGTRTVGPTGLAPVYDMLPMAFAPHHGELPPLDAIAPPGPGSRTPGQTLAAEAWQALADDPRASDPFRHCAAAWARALRRA
jgi:hypothetical protein